MEHVNALVVLGIHVSPRINQYLDHPWVPMVRRVVQWCESKLHVIHARLISKFKFAFILEIALVFGWKSCLVYPCF